MLRSHATHATSSSAQKKIRTALHSDSELGEARCWKWMCSTGEVDRVSHEDYCTFLLWAEQDADEAYRCQDLRRRTNRKMLSCQAMQRRASHAVNCASRSSWSWCSRLAVAPLERSSKWGNSKVSRDWTCSDDLETQFVSKRLILSLPQGRLTSEVIIFDLS